MALTKLTTDLIDGSLGTDWQATPKTADFTAVAGEGYFVNTTSATITVTLPSSPTAGDEINLVDYAGTANTNNITITSSDNINGTSDDVLINYERGGVSIVYVDATQGWIAYNAANETATALVSEFIPLTVDYLVIAGGGGGGGQVGGGGAGGGLRTSYANTSSLAGHTETSLSLDVSTNYSLTVGNGGNPGETAGGGNQSGLVGTNGGDSIFSSITSKGGGYGGAWNIPNGANGGSGGGGGASTNATGTGGSALTSPTTSGYNGGSGTATNWAGGGGGGANGIGSNSGSSTGGAGGAGLAVNILNTTNAGTASVGEVSGSDVYFSGGGGGCGQTPGNIAQGGLGGGGNGGYTVSLSDQQGPTNATDNTGGGGGGARDTDINGVFNNGGDAGSGGSGVVILRYPSDYTITVGSGITEASGSPFTESTDKVSVFTGGTGTITFS